MELFYDECDDKFDEARGSPGHPERTPAPPVIHRDLSPFLSRLKSNILFLR